MTRILQPLAVMGAALAVAGGVIAMGDLQTFVPPPEAVAENFARSLNERRYDIAAASLSRTLERSMGAAGLRNWFEPVRLRLGDTNTVEAATEWMTRDRASARAIIDAESGTAVLQVRLVREQGLWVIDELAHEVPVGLTSALPAAIQP